MFTLYGHILIFPLYGHVMMFTLYDHMLMFTCYGYGYIFRFLVSLLGPRWLLKLVPNSNRLQLFLKPLYPQMTVSKRLFQLCLYRLYSTKDSGTM